MKLWIKKIYTDKFHVHILHVVMCVYIMSNACWMLIHCWWVGKNRNSYIYSTLKVYINVLKMKIAICCLVCL